MFYSKGNEGDGDDPNEPVDLEKDQDKTWEASGEKEDNVMNEGGENSERGRSDDRGGKGSKRVRSEDRDNDSDKRKKNKERAK